jgi:hypothetical protein
VCVCVCLCAKKGNNSSTWHTCPDGLRADVLSLLKKRRPSAAGEAAAIALRSAPSRPLPSLRAAAAAAPSAPSAPIPAPPPAPEEGGAGPSASAPAPRLQAGLVLAEAHKRAGGSTGKTLQHMRKNLGRREFCEKALVRLPHRGSTAFFVRPGFEDEFRAHVEAYVTGGGARQIPCRDCRQAVLTSLHHCMDAAGPDTLDTAAAGHDTAGQKSAVGRQPHDRVLLSNPGPEEEEEEEEEVVERQKAPKRPRPSSALPLFPLNPSRAPAFTSLLTLGTGAGPSASGPATRQTARSIFHAMQQKTSSRSVPSKFDTFR